jgi:hypothetical protein
MAPIRGLWVGAGLSSLEELSIRSFLAHGHEYHLYSYTPLAHVPEGTVLRDAREILPEEIVFRHHEAGSLGPFSDVFRYELLRREGGWWVDLDVVCLRPFPEPEQYMIASLLRPNGRIVPSGAVLYAGAGSPLSEMLCERVYEKDWNEIEYTEIGPDLVSSVVAELGMQQFVAPWKTFCPIVVGRWWDTFLPGRAPHFGPQTLAVHMWHEMWRHARLDTDEDYGPNSLYNILRRRFGVTPRNGS